MMKSILMLNKELLMIGGGNIGTLTLSYRADRTYENVQSYIWLENEFTYETVFIDEEVSTTLKTVIIPVNVGDRLSLKKSSMYTASVSMLKGLDYDGYIFTVLENTASVNIELIID